MESVSEQLAAVEDEPSDIPGVSLANFARLCAQIIILVPHRPKEGVNASITRCNGQWGRWSLRMEPVEDEFSGDIAYTRAGMVHHFIDECAKTDITHAEKGLPPLKFLVMIDNDELIHPLFPVLLAFNDLPVVSAVVCSPSEHGGIKACFTMADAFGKPRFPSVRYTKRIPAKGTKEIHSAGAGLLCIRRDVLESILANGEYPFLMNGKEHTEEVEEFWASGTKKVGEDIQFTRQARRAGYQIHVDFGIMPGHRKEQTISWPLFHPATGEILVDPNLDPADWKIDVGDYAHGD